MSELIQGARCGETDVDVIKDPTVPSDSSYQFQFNQKGNRAINLNDILNLQRKIDEYRAKFKHSDLTMYTWHFNGEQRQGWTGGVIENKTLKLTDDNIVTSPTSLGVNASVYKYFTIKVKASNQCKLDIYDNDGKLVESADLDIIRNVDIVVPYEIQYTGTIDHIKITSPGAQIYYVKIDKVDPFHIESKVDIDAFNQMVEKVERLAGTPGGATKNLSFIKAKEDKKISKQQIVQLYNEFTKISPNAYNGCATCDVNQCTSCYQTHYGMIPCSTCDGCNEYRACTCDMTCYQQPTSCTCDMTCYSQPTSCTCNQRCYGYSGCTCNSSCYGQGVSCSVCNSCNGYSACTCNGSCHGYKGCTVCNAKCNAEVCTCQGGYGAKVCKPYLWCSACHLNGCSSCYGYTYKCTKCYGASVDPNCNRYNDNWCETYTYGGTTKKECTTCNGSCYEYSAGNCSIGYGLSGCSTCDNSCYLNTSCTCDGTCYGEPTSCTSCNNSCYSEATTCTCNNKCYGQPTGCTCNAICNAYKDCSVCNACNGYRPCSMCDMTCDGDQCRDCHNVQYH